MSHPSIWARPERAARGPVPEHSRAELTRAAVMLADSGGLAAVTMRSVAAAIGAAPASLYRYVATRDELAELMADQVYAEYEARPLSGDPATDLLELAQQGLAVYARHPWLLDLPPAGGLPGPNALAVTEQVLAALAPAGLSGAARLETVGLFSGAVRLAAQTERENRRAGQDLAQWQQSLGEYLLGVVTAGHHPHLAAALAEAAQSPHPAGLDNAIRRIIAGLLPT
jgi:AcrR family transcriptional regulator